MFTADGMRMILMFDIAAMALFALIYLRQRQLNWVEFCAWGLLAVGLPVLGPFLVIVSRPGRFTPNFSFWDDFRRLNGYLRRLLPVAPVQSARLAKARKRRAAGPKA